METTKQEKRKSLEILAHFASTFDSGCHEQVSCANAFYALAAVFGWDYELDDRFQEPAEWTTEGNLELAMKIMTGKDII